MGHKGLMTETLPARQTQAEKDQRERKAKFDAELKDSRLKWYQRKRKAVDRIVRDTLRSKGLLEGQKVS